MQINEEIILIASRKIPENENVTLLDALTILGEFQQTDLSFLWFLENLHKFQHNATREVAIGEIEKKLNDTWMSVNPNLYSSLIAEFMENIFLDKNFCTNAFLYKIYNIQALIIQQLYPSFHPDFFHTLIKYPKDRFYGFLRAFNHSMEQNSSIMLKDPERIKSATLENGSQQLLVQTILNDISNGVEGSYSALGTIVEWIDQDLITSSGIIGILFQHLNSLKLADDGLISLKNYLKRNHPLDILADFIRSTPIIQALTNLVNSDISNITSKNICELLKVLVLPLIDTPLAINFLEIENTLFMKPWFNVCADAADFLGKFFDFHREFAENIVDSCLTKLTETIKTPSPEQDLVLKKVISVVTSLSQKELTLSTILLEIASQIDPVQNPEGCATILTAISEVDFSNDSTEHLIQVLNLFRPLLSVRLPIKSVHFIAIANYSKLMIPIILKNNYVESALELFKTCSLVALNVSLDTREITTEYLLNSLMEISKNFSKRILSIDGIIDIVVELIKSKIPELLLTASHVLYVSNAQIREEIYISSLKQFLEVISDAKLSTNIKLLKAQYCFISNMNFLDINSDFNSILKDFFSNVKEYVNKNTYSNYVNASIKTLGVDSFQFFWDDLKYLDKKVYIAIAKVAQLLEKVEDRCHVALLLLDYSHSISLSEYRSRSRSDDEITNELFYSACLEFFIKSDVFHHLEFERQKEILFLVGETVSKTILSYELIIDVTLFLNCAANEQTLPFMLFLCKNLGLIFSHRPKPKKDIEKAKEFLHRILCLSRKQLKINPNLFFRTTEKSYRGSQISAALRLEYIRCASCESDEEFERRAAALENEMLKTYTISDDEDSEGIEELV